MNLLSKFQRILKAESEIKINKNVEENIKYINDDYIKSTIAEYIKLNHINEDVDLSNHGMMMAFIIKEIYNKINLDFWIWQRLLFKLK